VQFLNQFKAGKVRGMRDSCEDDLKRVFLGNPTQPIKISKQKIRSRLLRHTTGETNHGQGRIESLPGHLTRERQKFPLCLLVG
jgi:hypothetical protein